MTTQTADFTDIIAGYIRLLQSHGGANSAWTLLGGRVYKDQAPITPGRPYAVFTLIPGSIFRVFGGRDIRHYLLQVSIVDDYENDSAPAWAIWAAISREMQYAPLGLGNAQHMQTRLERLPTDETTENMIEINGDFLTEIQLIPQ